MEIQALTNEQIINALFDIAAIEANGNSEYGERLTLQDEQDYQRLDWELLSRWVGGVCND